MKTLSLPSFMNISGGVDPQTPIPFTYNLGLESISLYEGIAITGLGQGQFVLTYDVDSTPMQIAGSVKDKNKPLNINTQNSTGPCVAMTITKNHNQLLIEGTISYFGSLVG